MPWLKKIWHLLLYCLTILLAFVRWLLHLDKHRQKCDCPNPPPLKKPDPFLYCQYYLMALGFPVTWDNPDIFVFEGSTLVDPHQLKANTTYTIVARIWNNSTFVPVIHLNVAFSYLSFGMGTQSHPIGTSWTDLGVKGLANCPALCAINWTTPATLGHYCIDVLVKPPDDSNWLNNLGQRNIFVTQPQSPALFSFTVGNHVGPRIRKDRFKLDTFSIPPLPACPDPNQDARFVRKRAVSRVAPSVPDGWGIVLTPETLSLAPGEEQQVQAEITPPPGFTGTMPINVTGYDDNGPIGGVTLIVEAP